MPEFHAHFTPDIAAAKHRRSPSGTVKANEGRFRAIFGMPGNQHIAVTPVFHRISMMARGYFHHGPGREAAEFHTAIDLRLGNGVVDSIREIRNGGEDPAIG